MERYRLISEAFGLTEFSQVQERLTLSCLFGMKMHTPQADAPARLTGLLDDYITRQGVQVELVQASVSQDETKLIVRYESACGIGCELAYTLHERAGIFRVTLSLVNNGAQAAEVRRLQPHFIFASGELERYLQNSSWCYEGDGVWETLHPGGVFLSCEGGRTAQGSTPFLALRQKRTGMGIAFHILPTGNWEIRASSSSCGVGPQGEGVLQLTLGQSSTHFCHLLASGERLEMPQILIQALPDGMLSKAAPRLHRYLLDRVMLPRKMEPPVVYNTWMDCFDDLSLARLLERLAIAKDLGCEVFCVDAGWFGQLGDWSDSVGDWRERTRDALAGDLLGFADEVRKNGLAFGLWMEPERVTSASPIYLKHPDWFVKGSKGFYPTLWLPDVYGYIQSEILRVIDAYNVKWFKLDFNQEMEEDPSSTELLLYYRHFYRMIDEHKQARSDVVFENCASGGLRNDINTMSRFDVSFLSDNVNPWDGLMSFEQISMRALPGRVYRWLALQKGPDIPAYDRRKSIVEHTLVTPASPGAGFANCEVVDADFACKLVCSAPFGFTGDIATLDSDARACIQKHIAFYQKWRRFLINASLWIDAEPGRLGDRKSWHIHQFTDQNCEKCLIYAYRLNHIGEEKWVKVRGVAKEQSYRIAVFGDESSQVSSGEDLLRSGIMIKLSQRNSATIITIEQI